MRDVLTQEEARHRSALVDQVAYQIALDMRDATGDVGGVTTIRFRRLAPGPLWLDFAGGQVERVDVDGVTVPVDWDGARIALPGPGTMGRVTMRVIHRSEVGRTGVGLHRHVDTADGRPYLYTQFEPFAAHRVFPCFDQPDLKATFEVAIAAPPSWTVISNGRIASRRRDGHGRRLTTFAPVGPISTYLVAVMVGEFRAVRRRYGRLPITFYVRASLAPRLDAEVDAILRITAAGLRFFHRYFGLRMPFSKLDHVFLPEFRRGAMENVGAMALEESFLPGERATPSQLAGRAEILLHEIAHMWFGNLVTMAWWDDLWLKESLATYLSFLALEGTGVLDDPWVRFEAGRKAEAYEADRRATSHPIAGGAADTDATLVDADDIVYGKGPAVLHQLVATIGADAFRDALGTLVRDRAWGTASLDDLLDALAAASGRDLSAWASAWLDTRSFDTLSISGDPDAGPRRTMAIERHGPSTPTPSPRAHRVEVVLGWEEADRIETRSIPLTLDDPRTELPSVPGRPAPTFVVPDGSGRAYARILLDVPSTVALRSMVGRVADPLLRQIVWQGFWELLLEGRLTPTGFIETALVHAPRESHPIVGPALLGRVRSCVRSYVPASPSATRDAVVEAALRAVGAAGPTTRSAWMRLAIDSADTPAHLRAVAVSRASDPSIDAVVTNDMCWALATAATAAGMREATTWVDDAARRDPDGSAAGLAAVEAARPEAAAKARVWARIVGQEYPGLVVAEAAMAAFFRADQADLVDRYVGRYFDAIRRRAGGWDPEFALAFVEAGFPSRLADPTVVSRSCVALRTLSTEAALLARPLQEATDDLERAIRLRALTEERAPDRIGGADA